VENRFTNDRRGPKGEKGRNETKGEAKITDVGLFEDKQEQQNLEVSCRKTQEEKWNRGHREAKGEGEA